MGDNHPLTNRARKIADLQAERKQLSTTPVVTSISTNVTLSRDFHIFIGQQVTANMAYYVEMRLGLIDAEIKQQKAELRSELEVTT